MTEDGWNNIKHFVPKEFTRPEQMNYWLIARLDLARIKAGIPFSVSSSFRPGDPGAHGKGLAVDIRAHNSKTRFAIVKAAIAAGFPRIGVYDRHIHLDVDTSLPPGMWSGVSE